MLENYKQCCNKISANFQIYATSLYEKSEIKKNTHSAARIEQNSFLCNEVNQK